MKKILPLIIASLSCMASAHGAGLLVDFDNSAPADNTQTGWEAFDDAEGNSSAIYSGYTDLAAGNITVTTTGVEFVRNYNNGSAAAPDFAGTDLDKVYNDLILRNDIGADLDITISGLAAGTYQISTHHLIGAGDGTRTSEFNLLVQDADSALFAQNEGNFSMNRSFDGPTTIPVFNVTSNGIDDIIIRLDGTYVNPIGGTLNWIGINGLEIDVVPVPEPSSTALLGLGGLALILRRRR